MNASTMDLKRSAILSLFIVLYLSRFETLATLPKYPIISTFASWTSPKHSAPSSRTAHSSLPHPLVLTLRKSIPHPAHGILPLHTGTLPSTYCSSYIYPPDPTRRARYCTCIPLSTPHSLRMPNIARPRLRITTSYVTCSNSPSRRKPAISADLRGSVGAGLQGVEVRRIDGEVPLDQRCGLPACGSGQPACTVWYGGRWREGLEPAHTGSDRRVGDGDSWRPRTLDGSHQVLPSNSPFCPLL